MNKKHFIGMLIVLLISGKNYGKHQLRHYGEQVKN